MQPFSSPARLFAIVLSVLLVSATVRMPDLAAQSVPVPGAASAARRVARPALDQVLAVSANAWRFQDPMRFRIEIVRGDGAINNISQRTAGEPIVAIRDENDNPVAGIAVTFLLPDSGPSGTFANGQTSLTVVTDANGQAAGTGLTPNGTQGEFPIQVSATVQQQALATVINQTNTLTGVIGGAAVGAGISTKLIVVLAAIGGAAAAGTVVAMSGGESGSGSTPPPGPTPVVLQTGSPNVGPPPQ